MRVMNISDQKNKRLGNSLADMSLLPPAVILTYSCLLLVNLSSLRTDEVLKESVIFLTFFLISFNRFISHTHKSIKNELRRN